MAVMQEYFCVESDLPSLKLLMLFLQVLYLHSKSFKVLQDSWMGDPSEWKLDLCYGSTGRGHNLCGSRLVYT